MNSSSYPCMNRLLNFKSTSQWASTKNFKCGGVQVIIENARNHHIRKASIILVEVRNGTMNFKG